MLRSSIVLIAIFVGFASYAFIPKSNVILQKTAENNGNGSYVIEQEVQFQTPGDPFIVREVWTVDNEGSMRLRVSGTKEFKDSFKLYFVYNHGIKSWAPSGAKQNLSVGEDFFEKYFHIRSVDSYAQILDSMKIASKTWILNRPVRQGKNFDNAADTFVRLSRIGGTISYAFGTPSAAEKKDQRPGLWIEQDLFLLRKIRTNSGAEMTAEKYSVYPKGLNYPRKKTISWDSNSVQIQTLSVSSRNSTSTTTNLESSAMQGLEGLPVKSTVIDFYNRFR